jgi:hypothetical protein
MMSKPTFDIFAGLPNQGPIWLEAVEGLSNARERMEQIAAEKPGPYFVFSGPQNSIIARTETLESRSSVEAVA